MPHLIVKHVDIAWFSEERDGFAVLEVRIFPVIGVTSRVVTSGDDLGDAVLDGIRLAEREHDVEDEAGDGDIGVVARNMIRQWEVKPVIRVPSAALAGLISQAVLGHEVAVISQDGFCDAYDGFPNDDVTEYVIVFIHSHHADAANMVSRLVGLDSGVLPLAIHGRSQRSDFLFLEDLPQVVISVPVELVDDPSCLFFTRGRYIVPDDTSVACRHRSLQY